MKATPLPKDWQTAPRSASECGTHIIPPLGAVFSRRKICFGKAVKIMIPEENAHVSIFVNMKQYAAAETAANVFKAGYVNLRHIMPVHPADSSPGVLFSPGPVPDMGMTVKMNAFCWGQGQQLVHQGMIAVAAGKAVMAAGDHGLGFGGHFRPKCLCGRF